jgi:cytochrome oxidase assembly protein ShyY1
MSKAEKKNTGKLILSLISLCFVVLMTYLGFWQLERAEQKEQILKQWHGPSIKLEKVEQQSHLSFYQKVILKGHIDPQQYFFLDNRTRNGKVGYELIGIMRLAPSSNVALEEKAVFVNLGWLPGSVDRKVLPAIAMPKTEIEIEGWLKNVEAGMLLAKDNWTADWPIRIQQVDLSKMAAVISNVNYVPLLFLTQKPLFQGLLTQWKPTNMTVEKHLGYAVQWFLMAFVLVLMNAWFLLSNRIKIKQRNEKGRNKRGSVNERASS